MRSPFLLPCVSVIDSRRGTVPPKPVRSEYKMRSYQRHADVLVLEQLRWQSVEWMSSRMRIGRRMRQPGNVQRVQMPVIMLAMRNWRPMRSRSKSSGCVRMPKGMCSLSSPSRLFQNHFLTRLKPAELLGKSVHRMPRWMLWRSRLPGRSSSLLLRHLQEPMRWSLWCWSRLQSPRTNAHLQLPTRHDRRSIHQLSPVHTRQVW